MIRHPTRGFTLIELLLYIGTAVVLLSILSVFISGMFSARVKHQAIQEVDGSGFQILTQLTHAIRDAQDVVAPLIGTASTSVTLTRTQPEYDPTTVYLASTTLYMKEGNSTPVMMHGPHIRMTDLRFTNSAQDQTPGLVTFQFTLHHSGNRQEFDYSKTFYGSAALRQ